MAAEDIFIEAAITLAAMLGGFAYLHSRVKEEDLWSKVWLMGMFLTMYMGLGVLRYGFQHAAVVTSLSNLTFAAMQVMQWGIVLVFGYLMLSLAQDLLGGLMKATKGRGHYGQEKDPHRGN